MIDATDPASLTIRQMQSFHLRLDEEKGFDRDPIRNCAYLAEEVGEVVSAVRELARGKNGVSDTAARSHLASELADCLAYVLKLSNYARVDLADAYLEKMKKNLDRTWTP